MSTIQTHRRDGIRAAAHIESGDLTQYNHVIDQIRLNCKPLRTRCDFLRKLRPLNIKKAM